LLILVLILILVLVAFVLLVFILLIFVLLVLILLILVLLILIILILILVILLLLLLLLQLFLRIGQVIPRFVVLRIVQERLLIRFDAFFQLLRFQQGIPQVVIGFCFERLIGSRSGNVGKLLNGVVQLLL